MSSLVNSVDPNEMQQMMQFFIRVKIFAERKMIVRERNTIVFIPSRQGAIRSSFLLNQTEVSIGKQRFKYTLRLELSFFGLNLHILTYYMYVNSVGSTFLQNMCLFINTWLLNKIS